MCMHMHVSVYVCVCMCVYVCVCVYQGNYLQLVWMNLVLKGCHSSVAGDKWCA